MWDRSASHITRRVATQVSLMSGFRVPDVQGFNPLAPVYVEAENNIFQAATKLVHGAGPELAHEAHNIF